MKKIIVGAEEELTFDLEPSVSTDTNEDEYAFCVPVLAKRKIKSSNGEVQSRPVIKTHLMINNHRWNIELTLTNRGAMHYPMLLGREAMGSRILVDPSQVNLLG